MRTEISNKMIAKPEKCKAPMPCPQCTYAIPWKKVARHFATSIGQMNPGRSSMDSAEARRMVNLRWKKWKEEQKKEAK